MAQKAIYPMRYLRITQGEYGSYSHKGSPAHDNGGQSGGIDNATLAPYDGTVARVRQDSSHETYFVSDGPVETPCGYVGVLTTTLMHDNVLDVRTSQTLKQFAKLGDEGGFGGGRKDAFAHHTHLEVSKGKQTTQAKNKYGVYCTPNSFSLYDAFFLHPDTMVHYSVNGALQWKRAGDFPGGTVKDTYGHTWTVASDLDKPAQPPVLDTNKPMQLTVTASRCEYFTVPNVDNSAGKLSVNTKYEVLEYYPQEVVIGALRGHWVRFLAVDTMEYFCLVLPDRARLENVTNAWKPAAGDTVRVTAKSGLRVRSAPGEKHITVADALPDGTAVKLAEIADGWGYIQGKGWVSLAYVKAV